MLDNKPTHVGFAADDAPVDILFEGFCRDPNTIIVRLLADDHRQVAMTFNGKRSSRIAMLGIVAGKTYRVSYKLRATKAHRWDQLVFTEIVI